MTDIDSGKGTSRPLVHHGKAGEVWRIALKNFALSIVTLGIYRFWGTTNLRRYLWSRTELEGESLEYTGTGKELFVGFLIALVVIGVPIYGLAFVAQMSVAGGDHVTAGAAYAALALMMAFLTPYAAFRALRYRMTRTVWNGLCGNLAGSAAAYAARSMAWILAILPSFGLVLPIRNRALQRYRTERTSFGDRHFSFDAKLKPLYSMFLAAALAGLIISAIGGTLTWIAMTGLKEGDTSGGAFVGVMWLTIISLVLLRLTYSFAEWRYFMGCTQFGDAQLAFDASTASFIKLMVTNLLLTAFTLGLGGPYAHLRTVRFYCGHTRVEGSTDLDKLRQNVGRKPRQGEGLLDLLDTAEIG